MSIFTNSAPTHINFLTGVHNALRGSDLYLSLLNWQNLRLHCGCVAVLVNLFFVIISCFTIFKNIVHSLEPGETPSYSASHQAPNYVQRS